MAKLIISGKVMVLNESLEIINGEYFVDGKKVGNGDAIDNLSLTFTEK